MAPSDLPVPLALAGAPTPMVPMARLSRHLGLEPDRLWVKRDDLTALGGGGNKARKLEHLCADALARGATVLVTGGAVQSTHVRATGAAAAVTGLRAVGVVGGRRADTPEGNVILDALFGVELVYASERYGALDLADAITAECERLAAAGERPYPIPLGGSSAVGVQGYLGAAAEIEGQVPSATTYVAAGSGGTHAGLSAGFGDHARVRGADVGAVPAIRERVEGLAAEGAALAGMPAPNGSALIDGSQAGAGYGKATDAGLEAMRVAARHEGLVLDPVYTAKAFALLLADVRAGRLPEGPVVFLHTGGLPGLLVARYATAVGAAEPT